MENEKVRGLMSKGKSSFTEFNGLKALEDFSDDGSFRELERSQVNILSRFGRQQSYKIKANQNDFD